MIGSDPTGAAQGRSFWRGPWLIVGSVGAIFLPLVIFVVISRLQGSPTGQAWSDPDPAVIAEVTDMAPGVLDAVGTGGLPNPLTQPAGTTLLTGRNGMPEVVYVDAEWCPNCAAERWSIVVALSRFGQFHGLVYTTSSSTDVSPNTSTLSFAGVSYNSAYLDFAAVEVEDRFHRPLRDLGARETAIWHTYDSQGSIPFVDIANRYVEIGRGVPPDPLQGLSWNQIAAELARPSSPVTRAIVGNANYLIAAICELPGPDTALTCSSLKNKKFPAPLGG